MGVVWLRYARISRNRSRRDIFLYFGEICGITSWVRTLCIICAGYHWLNLYRDPVRDIDPLQKVVTVPILFTLVLNSDKQIPSFCQELEKIVLVGKSALEAVPSSYRTPMDRIFRSFHGDGCYISSRYQVAVGFCEGVIYYIVTSLNVITTSWLLDFQCTISLMVPIGFVMGTCWSVSGLLRQQIVIFVRCVGFKEFFCVKLI